MTAPVEIAELTPALQCLRRARRRRALAAVLPALPLVLAGTVLASRWLSSWQTALAAALALAMPLIYANLRGRRLDRQWLARQFDARLPELQDSSALLLGLELPGSQLAQWQQQRMRERLGQINLPDLRQPWPWRSSLLSGVVALICVAALHYWQLQPAAMTAASANSEPSSAVAAFTEIASATLEVRPPAYTGLPGSSGTELEVRVAENAELSWSLRFEPAPTAAWLEFHDRSRLALAGDADGHWRAQRSVELPTYYRIVVEGAPPLREARSWRIEVIKDQAPRISVQQPERSLTELDAGQSTWPLSFEANDDYGLGSARLEITLAQGSGEQVEVSERTVNLSGEGDSRSRRYRRNLDLAGLGFAQGDDLIVRLSVTDNRQPQPQSSRSASFILRWPAQPSAEVSELDGVVQRVMPAWFRSQRQIIIDTEALIARRSELSSEQFATESDKIGVDQRLLRLRYGQFLGEESETYGAVGAGGRAEHGDDEHSDDQHGEEAGSATASDGHDHQEQPGGGQSPVFGNAAGVIDQYGHGHDIAEATTLFDPQTRRLLKSALDEMWRAEEQLRTAAAQAALPFEYRALDYIKRVQQSTRIYLARVGLELPPIDLSRRLSGDAHGLANGRDPLAPAAPQDSPLPGLWRQLQDAQSELDLTALDAWLVLHADELDDALSLHAASDELRRDPGCLSCRERLRRSIFALLPPAVAGPAQRGTADDQGARYLRALQAASGAETSR